jgi:hypothetical protein
MFCTEMLPPFLLCTAGPAGSAFGGALNDIFRFMTTHLNITGFLLLMILLRQTKGKVTTGE